jgi:hypothetical protein
LLLEQGRLAGKRILAAHQLNGVVAKHHRRLGHGADLVLPLGRGYIDVGVVAGEPAHAIGKGEQRRRNRPADLDERGNDQ